MLEQSKPIAILISDIHFTVSTLELATQSLRQSLVKAAKLKLPLVIAGDTLDSKAIMRGEVVNTLLSLQQQFSDIQVYILVGNHDLLNEKGTEHTLNFMKPFWNVIDKPTYVSELKSVLIPYMSDIEELKGSLISSAADRVIIHQGVQTAHMGHYIQDKTSLPKEVFKDLRVISGHYHRAQDIKCGPPLKGAVGLFSYIGNPYTLSFGEAEDGPKGFQILNDDGTLIPVPTNLRAHVVLDLDISYALHPWPKCDVHKDDLIWMKIRGPYTELEQINKKEIGMRLLGHTNFKLDKIYTDVAKLEAKTDSLTEEQILDKMIDATDEKAIEKKALKGLWRQVLE